MHLRTVHEGEPYFWQSQVIYWARKQNSKGKLKKYGSESGQLEPACPVFAIYILHRNFEFFFGMAKSLCSYEQGSIKSRQFNKELRRQLSSLLKGGGEGGTPTGFADCRISRLHTDAQQVNNMKPILYSIFLDI